MIKDNKRSVTQTYQERIENQKHQLEQLKEFKELYSENIEKQD